MDESLLQDTADITSAATSKKRVFMAPILRRLERFRHILKPPRRLGPVPVRAGLSGPRGTSPRCRQPARRDQRIIAGFDIRGKLVGETGPGETGQTELRRFLAR